jgi:hypothetical protein
MDEHEESTEQQTSELEREERRLERLRLVVSPWPTPNYDDDEPAPTAA